jgi:hypothetical protein
MRDPSLTVKFTEYDPTCPELGVQEKVLHRLRSVVLYILLSLGHLIIEVKVRLYLLLIEVRFP